MNTTLLTTKKILITAGPTREAIDPVRYISNHSTGKMGYAIAEQLLQQGAEVVIISGPVHIALQHSRLKTVKVNSASEMYLACCHHFETADIAIFAAAVADYRPAKIAGQKIKKNESSFTISMIKNIDIAYEFGKIKTPGQLSIGFALETNDELSHAREKLLKKNFDMIILNSMNDSNACFGYDTNKITVIKKGQLPKEFPLKQKSGVAKDIVQEISSLLINQYRLEKFESFE